MLTCPVLNTGEVLACPFACSLCLSTASCQAGSTCFHAYIVLVPPHSRMACLLTCRPCFCAAAWQPGHACLHPCHLPILHLAELLQVWLHTCCGPVPSHSGMAVSACKSQCVNVVVQAWLFTCSLRISATTRWPWFACLSARGVTVP